LDDIVVRDLAGAKEQLQVGKHAAARLRHGVGGPMAQAQARHGAAADRCAFWRARRVSPPPRRPRASAARPRSARAPEVHDVQRLEVVADQHDEVAASTTA